MANNDAFRELLKAEMNRQGLSKKELVRKMKQTGIQFDEDAALDRIPNWRSGKGKPSEIGHKNALRLVLHAHPDPKALGGHYRRVIAQETIRDWPEKYVPIAAHCGIWERTFEVRHQAEHIYSARRRPELLKRFSAETFAIDFSEMLWKDPVEPLQFARFLSWLAITERKENRKPLSQRLPLHYLLITSANEYNFDTYLLDGFASELCSASLTVNEVRAIFRSCLELLLAKEFPEFPTVNETTKLLLDGEPKQRIRETLRVLSWLSFCLHQEASVQLTPTMDHLIRNLDAAFPLNLLSAMVLAYAARVELPDNARFNFSKQHISELEDVALSGGSNDAIQVIILSILGRLKISDKNWYDGYNSPSERWLALASGKLPRWRINDADYTRLEDFSGNNTLVERMIYFSSYSESVYARFLGAMSACRLGYWSNHFIEPIMAYYHVTQSHSPFSDEAITHICENAYEAVKEELFAFFSEENFYLKSRAFFCILQYGSDADYKRLFRSTIHDNDFGWREVLVVYVRSKPFTGLHRVFLTWPWHKIFLKRSGKSNP